MLEEIFYEIHVAGVLDGKWSGFFAPLKIYSTECETILSGYLPDQPALYGILIKIRDMGLQLISVKPVVSNTTDRCTSGV